LYVKIKNAIELLSELKCLKKRYSRCETRIISIEGKIQRIIRNVQELVRNELRRNERSIKLSEWIKDYLEIIKKGEMYNRKGFDKLSKKESDELIFWSWRNDLKERRELLLSLFSKQNIDFLTEEDVEAILQYSWAPAKWWSDKPWKAWEVLEKNGLSKFRNELKSLLYGDGALEERFDRFLRNIRGFGVDYTTEVLMFIYPENCCLWNRVAADISILLGINQLLPYNVWKYHMEVNGKDYIKCCRVLEVVKESLRKNGVESPNFLDIYHFMFCTFRKLQRDAPFVLKEIRNFSMTKFCLPKKAKQ